MIHDYLHRTFLDKSIINELIKNKIKYFSFINISMMIFIILLIFSNIYLSKIFDLFEVLVINSLSIIFVTSFLLSIHAFLESSTNKFVKKNIEKRIFNIKSIFNYMEEINPNYFKKLVDNQGKERYNYLILDSEEIINIEGTENFYIINYRNMQKIYFDYFEGIVNLKRIKKSNKKMLFIFDKKERQVINFDLYNNCKESKKDI